ncbi:MULTISPECIES: MerR family transcriptional regulator [Paenibacillus]|uniref:Transcriptional regulator, MerR family n=2 Tax=Paenibacillus lactis TaxID=228574 RepID=G4HIE1_9BACL|nr:MULTISPECIES: MerR family transcriptional regulator [Paenibacillus]EHB63114.1 transcriptional regulator, MerR family [Paenibacillus lactis 154]MBP1894843.1 DNA-binding transcriptional MerR regulator [Paenibacillus lactis]MCM3495919.1 MerR family transcriptional regulator [Paenibacillus lactis]GIO92727.1 transcriptional regulator [Paenibacillus lactis]HAG00304.1 MerR family transcriptional regulator [Paenibacillus lactis]
MKIGELSARTGVSIRSLRYYDKQGLLTPTRLENGYREYSPFAEQQVRTIQLYLNLGLSTEQIAGFLHCVMKNKEAFCKEVVPVYREKLAEIEEQIALLSAVKSNLEERIRSIMEEDPPNQPLGGE